MCTTTAERENLLKAHNVNRTSVRSGLVAGQPAAKTLQNMVSIICTGPQLACRPSQWRSVS
ncbi:unnamed protein product [Protopolystoma xenopodis]|uniref:Uncharacterized protein n=1 Tax=Protopolystoma xenopodis TaxID=117903 RepID=A0A448X3B3_9PLAT|nr:unnamed protein product [Protopolystoma xenopodis]